MGCRGDRLFWGFVTLFCTCKDHVASYVFSYLLLCIVLISVVSSSFAVVVFS